MKRFFVALWEGPLVDLILGLVILSSIGFAIWKISMSNMAHWIDKAFSVFVSGLIAGFVVMAIGFGAWFVGFMIRSTISSFAEDVRHKRNIKKILHQMEKHNQHVT